MNVKLVGEMIDYYFLIFNVFWLM